MDVVGIISTPFSGSTFLQRRLATHRDVFAAGEIDRIRSFSLHEHLATRNPIYIDHCDICASAGRACPVWTEQLLATLRSVGASGQCYGPIAEAAHSRIVVDGSKTPYWFQLILGSNLGDVRLHMLHLVRHPIGYAVSLARRRPDWGLEHAVMDWVIVNTDISRLLNLRGSAIASRTLLQYEKIGSFDPGAYFASIGITTNLGTQGEQCGDELHILGSNVGALWDKYPAEAVSANWEERWKYRSRLGARGDEFTPDFDWIAQTVPETRNRLVQLPGVSTLASMLGYTTEALIGLWEAEAPVQMISTESIGSEPSMTEEELARKMELGSS